MGVDRLHLGWLGSGALGDLDQMSEGIGVVHGHVGQHLAIDFDLGGP
jgi:hypothetical protein